MKLIETLGPEQRWLLRGLLGRRVVSERAPLVLGGADGSGATLVARALDAHPDIACALESTVFLERLADPDTIAARVGLAPAEVRAMLRASGSQTGFVERLMRARLAAGGEAVWADKTARNVRRLTFLFRHFPWARFVHVVRDGRDVACALRAGGESGSGNRRALERAADARRDAVGGAIRWRRDPRCFAVTYEDLAVDPEAALRDLLDRLDIEWHDAVATALGEAAARFRSDPAGRWRDELSPGDLLAIEQRIAAGLSAFGYTIESFRSGSV